jgi:hypothetical protein
MSLWKNSPKCSPTHFCQHLCITVILWKKVAQNLAFLYNFQKTAQSISNSIAQYTKIRPIWSLCPQPPWLSTQDRVWKFQAIHESAEGRGPFLTSPLAPRGESCLLCSPLRSSPGVNTLYCLEEWRGEQGITSPVGYKNSPPGDNFAPAVKVCP